MDLITNIKKLAHDISEGYILYKKPINTQIYQAYDDGDIDNHEILKRVCELVNQNVYLSLFHDNVTDNANIIFDLANYDKLVEDINKTEADMQSYDQPIEDFRDSLIPFIEGAGEKLASDDTQEKIAMVHDAIGVRDSLVSFRSVVKMAHTDAVKTAEQSYLQMKDEAKDLCYNGESIDDMSKLAEKFIGELDLQTEKTASAYTLIKKELEANGNIVHTGLSKIASEPVNHEAEFYRPIEKFATAVEVVSASKELLEQVDTMINKLAEAMHA